MTLLPKDELVGENDIARFYRNSITQALDKEGSPIGLKCLIAERKDGTLREFIVVNRKQEAIKSHTSFEAIALYIDVRRKLAKR